MKKKRGGIAAFKLLFKSSSRVTCNSCGRNLTGTRNLPRLARLGCPQCGSKTFDYDLPEEAEARLNAVMNRA